MPLQQEDLPIFAYGSPIVGVLVAANLLENPPGNGPGGLQVAVAVVTPLVLTSAAARRVGLPWPGVARWAMKSVVGLGAILLLWVLLVAATVGSGL
jgi:hypothetical protein